MKRKIALMVGLLTNLAVSQNVVINELMYGPTGGEPEWVEVFNAGLDSVDIKHWTICDKSGVRYTLTISDRYIQSHSYLVLTNSNTFAEFHPEASRSYIVINWPQYFLVNSGDTVSLRDDQGQLVDSVYYTPSWGGSGGKSLERKSASDSSRLKENWGTSADPGGSTPGRKNSITLKDYDLKLSTLSAIYLPAESKAVFNLSARNVGTKTAPSFSVNVFIDFNADSLASSGELVATDSGRTLNQGDSIHLLIEKNFANPGRRNVIAILNCASDEDTTNNEMITRLNFSYATASVVVNEIMYAPVSPRPEWVELFNTSDDTVCLAGFSLADNSGTQAVFPDSSLSLPPSGYLVVAHDSSFFIYNSEFAGEAVIIKIPSLNNSGDAVILHDAAGHTLDSVAYSPSWGGNSGGNSLERILPLGGSNDPQNFETCGDSLKSTPGRINSVTPRDHDLAIGSVSWFPTTLRSGDNATVSASIVNTGLKSSGGAIVVLFIDMNRDNLFSSGEFVDSTAVMHVSSGDSVTVSLRTGTLAHGTYHFGILIDFPDDERESNNMKFISLNVGLPPAAVVINEIMYAPKKPGDQEWLELFNPGTEVIDLSNFRIVTHGSSVKIKNGLLIAPNDFAVLCKDSSITQLYHNARNILVQSVPSMNNSGDGIGLRDNLGNLLDTMTYVPTYGGSTGKSLERVDYLAGDDSTNWVECVDSAGATPGFTNSVAILPYDVAIERLDLSAAAKSPGETGTVSVVVGNCGRNSATGISVCLNVLRVLDSTIVYSGTKSVGLVLAPKDSVCERFNYTLDKSGLYTFVGRAIMENDTRYWNDTLSAKLKVGFVPGSIVINEIMFTSGPLGEYFEVYNACGNNINLDGWRFHTSSGALKPIAGNKLFRPAEYFVVAADSAILNLVPDTSMVHISKSMGLPDDGSCIVLIDPSENVVDSVCYLPSWHNSDIARTSGRSLEKINPSLPSNEKTSWSTCVSQSGGTPGTRNSLFVDAGQATGAINVGPNPFSPDADGHDDFTFISYSFPVTSVKIRLRIFDSVGRLIATPADNIVLPSTGKLVWDGRDASGRIVRFGLYILFMEVTGPDGRSLSTYKAPLVVAKRMR